MLGTLNLESGRPGPATSVNKFRLPSFQEKGYSPVFLRVDFDDGFMPGSINMESGSSAPARNVKIVNLQAV